MRTVVSTIAAMLVGGAVATFTLVGVIDAQTSGPDQSPANVNAPADEQITYGSTN